MENSISKFPAKITAFSVVVIFLATGLLFACKKDAGETKTPGESMDEIALILDGKTLSGSVESISAGNELALNYDNGRQFILIAKMPGVLDVDANSSQSAELITSKYGVVIKDLNTKKIWLFANNDEESILKFEEIKSRLTGSYQSTVVFGTTIVQARRS